MSYNSKNLQYLTECLYSRIINPLSPWPFQFPKSLSVFFPPCPPFPSEPSYNLPSLSHSHVKPISFYRQKPAKGVNASVSQIIEQPQSGLGFIWSRIVHVFFPPSMPLAWGALNPPDNSIVRPSTDTTRSAKVCLLNKLIFQHCNAISSSWVGFDRQFLHISLSLFFFRSFLPEADIKGKNILGESSHWSACELWVS